MSSSDAAAAAAAAAAINYDFVVGPVLVGEQYILITLRAVIQICFRDCRYCRQCIRVWRLFPSIR